MVASDFQNSNSACFSGCNLLLLEFHRAMENIYYRAKGEVCYSAKHYIQIVPTNGAVETAKMLVNANEPSD